MLWHISYIFLDRVEFAQLRTSHKFRIPFSDAAGSIFRSSAVEANRAVPLDQRLAEAFTRSLYLKKKKQHYYTDPYRVYTERKVMSKIAIFLYIYISKLQTFAAKKGT